MHLALYGLVLAVLASGMAVALQQDLFAIVLGQDSLPVGLTRGSTYPAHVLLTKILMVASAGHGLAALWRQFVKGDNLLSRMWFGRRAN